MSRYGSRLGRAFDPFAHAAKIRSIAAVGGLPKFGNVKTDGYDSKREANRATQLKLMQRAGQIRNLREKVLYVLIPKQDGERACTYTADYVYEQPIKVADELGQANSRWETIVEDVKGYPNDRWAIKRKLMLFVHGIRVREV